MSRRIEKNDLLPWFTQDHGTLPASYLKSCAEFFKWLEDCKRTGFKAPSNKPQAPSLTRKNYNVIGEYRRKKK